MSSCDETWDHIGVRVNKLFGLQDQAVQIIMASDEVASVFAADELNPEKMNCSLSYEVPDETSFHTTIQIGW